MLKFTDLKNGDYVYGEYEGKMWEGEVLQFNRDEKQVRIATDVQDFWFEPKHIFPIPLDDEQMKKLKFSSDIMDDGRVKYKKGAFRLIIPSKDDFSKLEMWYREDIRYHPDIHYVHELQNHYYAMTKVHLNKEVMI